MVAVCGVERIKPGKTCLVLCDGVDHINTEGFTEQGDKACSSPSPPEEPSGSSAAAFGLSVPLILYAAGSKNMFTFVTPKSREIIISQPCEQSFAPGSECARGPPYPDDVGAKASK